MPVSRPQGPNFPKLASKNSQFGGTVANAGGDRQISFGVDLSPILQTVTIFQTSALWNRFPWGIAGLNPTLVNIFFVLVASCQPSIDQTNFNLLSLNRGLLDRKLRILACSTVFD